MKCKVTSITFDFDEEDDIPQDAYDKDKLAVEQDTLEKCLL
jgi:hypothetical protein